jgi:hypothetical protein
MLDILAICSCALLFFSFSQPSFLCSPPSLIDWIEILDVAFDIVGCLAESFPVPLLLL